MMPSRISSRTGRTMANSTITAPRSSCLGLDMFEPLRASGTRPGSMGAGIVRRPLPPVPALAAGSGQLVDDVLEEAVDRAAEDEDGGHHEDGDAGDEDAVLDHRGALVVLAPGGEEGLDELND